MDRLIAWCESWWGPGEKRPGIHRFGGRLVYGTGAQIWYAPATPREDGSADVFLELPGSVLAEFDGDDAGRIVVVRDLVKAVGIPTAATRLDLFVEYLGEGIRLIDELEQGFNRKELTGAKRCERLRTERYVHGGRQVVGDTIYLGKRGKGGSGRLVRCYDKGLEDKDHPLPPGRRIRYEVELTGNCAESALLWIRAADRWDQTGEKDEGLAELQQGWIPQALSFIFGAIDFREPGLKSRSLKRRKRCAWWAAVVGDRSAVRLRRRRRPGPSLASTTRWMQRCVLPTLADASRLSGRRFDQVLADFGVVPDGQRRQQVSVAAME